MPLVKPTDLTLGQRVRFRTINTFDLTWYIGTVTAIGQWDFARRIEDLVPYYQTILKTHADVPPLEESTYIQLTTVENGTQPSTIRAFAREWIDASTLSVLEETTSFKVEIFGAQAQQADDILQLLRSAGFTVQVVATGS